MTGPRISDREPVLKAVEEFNRIGRERFLAEHGYGKAKDYFLYLDGRLYDSKAICGVAHGYEHPGDGPLKASDFSGGEATVARVLEVLGFTVVKGLRNTPDPSQPLVLVENEVTVGGEYDHWRDDTGVRYQYPNSYRNRVAPGRPFVYYRGTRRSDRRSGRPEYFGSGVVGRVWRDPAVPESTPKKNWRWYCEIEEYCAFDRPVPAKQADGYIENIQRSMGWRTGVREISAEQFNRIMFLAGVASGPLFRASEPVEVVPVSTANPSRPTSLSEVLAPTPVSALTVASPSRSYRRPRDAKRTGDWAEEVVYLFLRRTLPESQRETVDWIARRGQTPGWDIQYTDGAGEVIAVEVKGTTAARFPSIELTSNEWDAAAQLKERYSLYLVARALTKEPAIAVIRDPHQRYLGGDLFAEPTSWRLYFRNLDT